MYNMVYYTFYINYIYSTYTSIKHIYIIDLYVVQTHNFCRERTEIV